MRLPRQNLLRESAIPGTDLDDVLPCDRDRTRNLLEYRMIFEKILSVLFFCSEHEGK